MRFLISWVFLFFITKDSIAQKYIWQSHKDSNGFSYQTVTNDPFGLRRYKLKNGLTVFLAKNTIEPVVYCQVAVKAGSIYDPSDNTGLSHYLEHLLFNGTSKIGTLNYEKEKLLIGRLAGLYELYRMETDSVRRKSIYKSIDSLSYEASKYGIKDEYRSLLSGLGVGGANAETRIEYVTYGAGMPVSSLKQYLMIEKERFTSPAFRFFTNELEIVYEEFNSIRDNAFWQLYIPVAEKLFEGHPYGSNFTIGQAKHIKNPSLKATMEYYQKRYIPDNMSVAIVGDIDFEKTIQWVDKAFRDLKGQIVAEEKRKVLLPIQKPVVLNIASPGPEKLWLAYRLNGYGSDDYKYLVVFDKMLTNKVAGLFNLELKDKQKAASVSVPELYVENDYSAHFIEAQPVIGQSLENLKDEILSFIEKMKKGDFEEWLIEASVNEIQNTFVKDVTVGGNLEVNANRSFLRNFDWAHQLQFYDDIKKITKSQMVDFLNRIYSNNYVLAYKRKGNTNDFTHIEKPTITTPFSNDGKQSLFVKNFTNRKLTHKVPEFINYDRDIYKKLFPNGSTFYNVKSASNNLFNLDIVFDIGKEHDALYALAIDFLKISGTEKFTNEDLKKELYRYSLNFNISVHNRRTVFHIDGPDQSLTKGISLINHIIDNCSPDQQAFNKYIQHILSARNRSKSDRTQIRRSLSAFALYGENSVARDVLQETDMKSINLLDLKNLITSLKQYKYKVLYEGRDPDAVFTTFTEKFITKAGLSDYPDKRKYVFAPSSTKVYFTQFQGVQAEILVLKPMKKFDSKDLPYIYMLNRFIEKVAYAEIREKRSLAYATYAACSAASDTFQHHQMEIYAGVQTDKVIETVLLIDSIFKNLEKFSNFFEVAKADQLRRHEREKVYGSSLLFKYIDSQNWNIHEDPMKAVYYGIKKMTFEDLISFYNKELGSGGFAYTIVGDRKIIDLKKLESIGTMKEMNTDYLFNY